MKKSTAVKLIAAVAVFAGVGAASAGTVYDKHDAKMDFSFEAGLGAFSVGEANFGAGQDFDPSTSDDRDTVNWSEYYMKPKLNATYSVGGTTVYGEWSVVAAATGHDGDAIGFTEGGDEHMDTETAFLGWKSGKLFSDLGENAIEIYGGRAPIVIADGFVMGDGAFDGDSALDGGQRPNFWMAPHSAFKWAGVMKVNTEPVRGDIFWFEADYTHGNTQGVGVNVEAAIGKYGKVGAMYISLFESDRDTRDGMNVIEARYYGNPLADVVEGTYLNLEYANETNDDEDVKAFAFAGELGYSIGCPGKPTVAYRYSHYSGDDLGTSDNEGYDPLFQKAFARSWGTWLEGEIFGEYFYSNSNKVSHTLMVKAQPLDSLAVSLLAFRFYAAEDNFYGEDLSSKHLADEINLTADWTVAPYLLLSGAVGYAKPGKGLKDLGFDEETSLAEIYAILTF